MNLRNVIQLEQVPFLSGSDHSRTNITFHPKVCVQEKTLVLSAPSFLSTTSIVQSSLYSLQTCHRKA